MCTRTGARRSTCTLLSRIQNVTVSVFCFFSSLLRVTLPLQLCNCHLNKSKLLFIACFFHLFFSSLLLLSLLVLLVSLRHCVTHLLIVHLLLSSYFFNVFWRMFKSLRKVLKIHCVGMLIFYCLLLSSNQKLEPGLF